MGCQTSDEHHENYYHRTPQEIAQELKEVFDAGGEVGEEWPKPSELTQAIPRNSTMRTFGTGATRNTDEGKFDFEGFFSPLVLERRAAYMHKHRLQADGNLRASDNWQFGIPLTAYMKSAYRHFHEWWKAHRGTATEPHRTAENLEESICSLMFNCEGYLHEILREKHAKLSNTR